MNREKELARLRRIEQRYLGEKIRDFRAKGGNIYAYAAHVFSRRLPGFRTPGDEELGILTQQDLVEAFQQLERNAALPPCPPASDEELNRYTVDTSFPTPMTRFLDQIGLRLARDFYPPRDRRPAPGHVKWRKWR